LQRETGQRLPRLAAPLTAFSKKSSMATVVWMACPDGECAIKLFSGHYRREFVRQRNPAKSDGLVGSGQRHGAPSIRRPNRKEQLLYAVVLERANDASNLRGRQLLTLAIREHEHRASTCDFVGIAQQIGLRRKIAMGARDESRDPAEVELN
jgi:hypothetical protein